MQKKVLFPLIALLALTSLACNLAAIISKTPTPQPSNTPRIPTDTPEPSKTPRPSPTIPLLPTPSFTPRITDTPTLEPYYYDELDGNVDRWMPAFVVHGDETGFSLDQDSDGLLLTISAKDTYVYLMDTAYSHSDVRLDLSATNYGFNENNISLVCRYSSNGWYEFSSYSNGYYQIFRYDAGEGGGYTEIKEGGIRSLKTGKHENVFSAICVGDKLTLVVNDIEIGWVNDNTYSEGGVGINVSSFTLVPVEVHLNWVQVSQP